MIQILEVWLIRLRLIRNVDREVQSWLMSHHRATHKNGEVMDVDEVGFNVYSPTYEDGVLLYIFSLIGTTNRKLVDIGAGPIRASSTTNLIINHGFTGLLIDADKKNVRNLRSYYSVHPETTLFPPKCACAFVTMENVNDLIERNGVLGEIDLLGIDIDGVDYWIWKAIHVIRPRVVLVEYQDNLGPNRSWTVPYRPDFNLRDYPQNRQYNNYCGASLTAFVRLGRERGYRLVGCNRGGWNAFFVRDDLGSECLPEVSSEDCFRHDWNQFSMEQRFPPVAEMDWQEV
ncbi:hypothetical protein ACGF5M_05970 [Gemmatimonadota bacterium]